MDKNQVIEQLRSHRHELQAAGAEHMSLFGSVARGDNHTDSDIDIAVILSEEIILSGWGYYSALTTLQERLEKITGRKVDLVAEPFRKERFRQEVERDRAIAF